MERRISQYSILSIHSCLIALFLFFFSHHAGSTASPMLFLEILFVSFVLTTTGYIFLITIKATDLASAALFSILPGYVIVSLFINFITHFFAASALNAFLYWVVGAFLPLLIAFRKQLSVATMQVKPAVCDIAITIFLIGLIIIWCHATAVSDVYIERTGILPAWYDYYLHGMQVAQFADVKAIGQGSIAMIGEPLSFYHRATYMFPALIAELADLSGLAASMGIQLPMGFMLLGIAIYSLGGQLLNQLLGVLGIICIYLLPDAARYGLNNDFLGVHFALFIAVGAAYGIAIAFASMQLFVVSLERRSKLLWLAAVFLGMSIFFFRAHFFILYLPALLLTSIFFWFENKKNNYHLVAGMMLALLAGIALCNHSIRSFWLKKSALLPFLETIHLYRGETRYTAFYQYIMSIDNKALTIFVGLALFFVAILGVWTLVLPVLSWIKIKQKGYAIIDLFPYLFLLVLLGIVLFAPATSYGDPTEYQQRAVGLVYSVFVIFSLLYALQLFNQKLVIGGVFLVIFCSLFTNGGLLYVNHRLPINHDLYKVARYLKQNSIQGDVLLVSTDDTDSNTIDSASIVTSISGVPDYISRSRLQALISEHAATIVATRLVAMNVIANAKDLASAYEKMRSLGVTWYIALSPPLWDHPGENCCIKSGSICLYHITTNRNQNG